MAAPTVTALVATAYTEIAADASALLMIQCPKKGTSVARCIEIVTAATLPAVTVRGIELMAGERILDADMPSIGAGKLWAKPAWGDKAGEILTVAT